MGNNTKKNTKGAGLISISFFCTLIACLCFYLSAGIVIDKNTLTPTPTTNLTAIFISNQIEQLYQTMDALQVTQPVKEIETPFAAQPTIIGMLTLTLTNTSITPILPSPNKTEAINTRGNPQSSTSTQILLPTIYTFTQTPTLTATHSTLFPTSATIIPTSSSTSTVVPPTVHPTSTLIPPTSTVVPPTVHPTSTLVPPTSTVVPPTVHPTSTLVPPTLPPTTIPTKTKKNINACEDGIDNDGDGYTDWPADPQCHNKNDNSEGY